MISQLLLTKRLFVEACEYAAKHDAFACGLAISLLQDATEMLVWALIKEKGVSIKDGSAFTTNLELLQKAGVSIPEAPKLLELNKARVGFKHYGNLPAPAEAQKCRTYVEDFLTGVIKNHFNRDFSDLSLVDLVPFDDIKDRLKAAEQFVKNSEFNKAVREASIAKVELFAKLSKYIPRVDSKVGNVDTALSRAGASGVKVFGYLAGYLDMLREMSLVTLLRIPLEDYAFLNSTLFHASQSMTGKWTVTETNLLKHDQSSCRRQIGCLVDVSIRLKGVV